MGWPAVATLWKGWSGGACLDSEALARLLASACYSPARIEAELGWRVWGWKPAFGRCCMRELMALLAPVLAFAVAWG
jgi:hypothetical protein